MVKNPQKGSFSYFCQKQKIMGSLLSTCFVCKKAVTPENSELNTNVNLAVCEECRGTEAEKHAEKEALDSLADGFVCGCI